VFLGFDVCVRHRGTDRTKASKAAEAPKSASRMPRLPWMSSC